ncbi:hypothetical protein K6119_04250 [Paracrocinitomix mangrovi]|uniref:hypothetical protein n=1 Tax=Paracrocinitomix mangrovi TaxID=2862509 RepID=UPI001C8D5C06|nr:hypothetical protein [Paracrocinitomix mangrovi]UKN02725.1 hypothetical protein K6119_04250 [Paracrocinitomix mangrovi]
MNIRLTFYFLIVLLPSCGSKESKCECPKCPEKETHSPPVCRPEGFSDSSSVILNFFIDTNYIAGINSDTLKPAINLPFITSEDQGHEGYPFILGHLDYFVLDSFIMSDELVIKLIYAEIPKDTIQDEIDYYRIIHLMSYDSKGNFTTKETICKRYIRGEYYSSVLTEFDKNDITISKHEQWKSASGRLYSEWSDNYYVLTYQGYLKEWAKSQRHWCKD